MKHTITSPLWLLIGIMTVALFSCGGKGITEVRREADSLNLLSYQLRYKDLDAADSAARRALLLSSDDPVLRAEALNNLGFCAFMRMDFEGAESLFKEVHRESDNELERLIADIGLMKIYQRTAMNKEFYDYRNAALRRMKRIDEDPTALNAQEQMRLNYARSEFSIASAIYYYYLQQEEQSLQAIDEVIPDEVLEADTAQLLYYYYMKGSGGMYEAPTADEVALGEFNYLMECAALSHEYGYTYFEANASQAMAELMKDRKTYDLLLEHRPGMMRALNNADLPWEELTLALAEYALNLFQQYGDWYQISVAYRTLASCCNEQGRYEEALGYLSQALNYVNRHHEKYYHCNDTTDRLRPYVPMATASIELEWINAEGIKTVPEWIARFREQLSVTYAALGMKPESDYNRNVYLDILDYTRQDKELESRYMALEEETASLNRLLALVITGIVVLVVLFWFLNRRWRKRDALYIDRLRRTLEICRKITASIPSDATEEEEVVEAITEAVRTDIEALKKEDAALMEVIQPYIGWAMENGYAFVSLGDERRRLEKEQYVHRQHLAENKRQNLVKKACLFIVTGITPYIDRIINEVRKLTAPNFTLTDEVKEGKYRYIDELITRINEYNDILAQWIKMRQGTLSLNIENFELNGLFDVLVKGRKTFEMKHQTLDVQPTDAVVKADKALTLFMINTLTENARKYTQEGGNIRVSAEETDAYVEISVQDNGPGLPSEEVEHLLKEKVYKESKGHGFGLMNCKGIIEKYRKTNDIFRVCLFGIESTLGQGSRFYFRLPKGVRKAICVLTLLLLHPFASTFANAREADYDRLLEKANHYANEVYRANIDGDYQQAISFADSAFLYLNEHYKEFSGKQGPILTLAGEGNAAELEWFDQRFDTDYYALLDVRNEAAVAFLALGNLEAYRYNNTAYTALYKQISKDASLEEYCRQMQLSANNKTIAIILCVCLLIALAVGYYLLYLRHRLNYRYNLEQVLEVNRLVLSASQKDEGEDIASTLVREMQGGVNELLPIDTLALAVWHDDRHTLEYAFSTIEEDNEPMREAMAHSFQSETARWQENDRIKCLPLWVETGEEKLCTGVLAVKTAFNAEREDDRLMLELIASYVAIILYHKVVLMAQKYRDIESAQDEARLVQREENRLHVQNQVLDNCLSTIKHETIYYPNRIKQIIDRLNGHPDASDEREQVQTISELISYYKDIFTLLSSCAARQLEEITFRRGKVQAQALADDASRYLRRVSKRLPYRVELFTDVEDVAVLGDDIQLKYLLENLIDEALGYEADGRLMLTVRREGAFVRFDFTDTRRSKSQAELNELFFPHLARMNYLICKQIIRDHDEFAGRRGCRINACPSDEGGFTVWFTVPAR